MCPDLYDIHKIWRETASKLEIYAQRVRERQDIQAASEFARWVRFSGLSKLFTLYAQGPPHTIDAGHIEKLAQDLIWSCGEAWRKQGEPFSLSVSQAERMNAKLDLIAGQLAKISPPVTATTAGAEEPAEPVLRVLPGGV